MHCRFFRLLALAHIIAAHLSKRVHEVRPNLPLILSINRAAKHAMTALLCALRTAQKTLYHMAPQSYQPDASPIKSLAAEGPEPGEAASASTSCC